MARPQPPQYIGGRNFGQPRNTAAPAASGHEAGTFVLFCWPSAAVPVGRLWYKERMMRSTPAVAVVLVLALTGARVVAAACVLSCLYATDASSVTPVATSPSESAPPCHAVVDSTDESSGLLSRKHADACGQHATPEPFVLVSKSVASAHMLDSPAAARRGIPLNTVDLTPTAPSEIAVSVAPRPVPLRL